MKKTAITPLTSKVLESYDNGNIELLYSKEVKIGNSIPFIIRKRGDGNIVATIFIMSFGSMDNNTFNIPVKQLYALMESAYVALEMQKNPMKIQRNVGLMRICCDVYTAMFVNIINR